MSDIVIYLCKKILIKIKTAVLSFRFRVCFGIYTGKIRADSASVARSLVGAHAIVLGSITCRDASVRLGEFFTMAKSAEIGVEDGEIVVGQKVSIGPRTIISTSGSRVEIGNGTTFFSDCIISGAVSIGAGCLFAKNVTILSSKHEIHGDGTIRENDLAARLKLDHVLYEKVVIGDDCWLGSNSVILPGVTLAKGVVVGANAVVTKDFPEYSIIAGIPAKQIGSRLRQDVVPDGYWEIGAAELSPTNQQDI